MVPADRFFRLAERLVFYPGVVAGRATAQGPVLVPAVESPRLPVSPPGVHVVDGTTEALKANPVFREFMA